MKKEIKIIYFALLREKSGLQEENWTTSASTPKELYAQLQTRYQFPLEVSDLRVAINGQFQSMDFQLKCGETLAFIPPVSGG